MELFIAFLAGLAIGLLFSILFAIRYNRKLRRDMIDFDNRMVRMNANLAVALKEETDGHAYWRAKYHAIRKLYT